MFVLVHHIHREQWPVVYDPLRARVGWFIESVAAPRQRVELPGDIVGEVDARLDADRPGAEVVADLRHAVGDVGSHEEGPRQVVVQEQAQADQPGRPHARVMRHHKPQRPHDVGRTAQQQGRLHGQRHILREAPGCQVIDKRENGGYITPVECAGEDATYISRIREDATVENGLNMWVVSDNLRKGAALNAVQIAEELIKGYI